MKEPGKWYEIQRVDGYPRNKFLISPYIGTCGIFPVQLRFAGPEVWKKNVCCTRRHDENASIEFIRSGAFSYERGEKKYLAEAGDLLLLLPVVKTVMRCQSDYAEKNVIAVSGTGLQNLITLLGMDHLDKLKSISAEKWDHWYTEATRLLNGKNTERAGIKTAAFAYSLLLELSRENRLQDYPETLRRALSFLHRELETAPALEMVIRASGGSRMTLFRQFKKHIGMNPMEYVRHLRMNRAAELLKGSMLSAKEISNKLNFSSPQYFSSEFRRFFGVSPKKLRMTGQKEGS